MGEPKDFGCIRNREVAGWKRDPSSLCWKDKDMKHKASVVALDSELMIAYGCNLNRVSSEAIRPYMELKDKKANDAAFKAKVLRLIIDVLKSEKDPFSGKPFGYYGLTEAMVKKIIKFLRTDIVPAPRGKPKVPLSIKEIACLDWMRKRALDACKTEAAKDNIVALYKKIRGL